jgi:N-acyl-D-amino-acid deacylase
MTYELLIKNGTIIDGTGAPWIKADLAVEDEHIAKIGDIKEGAERVLDAKGLVVSPGWIDIHVHARGTELRPPRGDHCNHGELRALDLSFV